MELNPCMHNYCNMMVLSKIHMSENILLKSNYQTVDEVDLHDQFVANCIHSVKEIVTASFTSILGCKIFCQMLDHDVSLLDFYCHTWYCGL